MIEKTHPDKNHEAFPMILFTDSSVSPQSKLAVGGYLLVSKLDTATARSRKSHQVQLKTFADGGISSTELELRTMIWALGSIQSDLNSAELTVYTDSQNVAGLIDRRARLEQKEFRNRFGERMKQADQYQIFFGLLDKLNQHTMVEIVKIKGHRRRSERTELEQLFSLVDQATRHRLRSMG